MHSWKDKPSDFETGLRIQRALVSAGIRHQAKEGSPWISVVCPHHNISIHGDHGLKLGIHVSGRYGQCYVCKVRNEEGGWDAYAQKVGSLPSLEELTGSSSVDGDSFLREQYSSLKRELEPRDSEVLGFSLPKGLTMWDKGWRKLRASFVRALPAFRWWDEESGYYRILFPITHEKILVGYTAGRAEPHGKYPKKDLKYKTSSPFPADKVLFMLDQIPRCPYVVLTEGPYDALRLLQWGIPAVAILGGQNWSEKKADILVMRPGIRRVFLAFDADRGGDEATDTVRSSLDSKVRTTRIRIEGGKDPGDAPRSWVKRVRRELSESTGWKGPLKLRPILDT